ncbi:hypothetical protein REPUB_Repub01dG0033700 [Reevesia pubescens]
MQLRNQKDEVHCSLNLGVLPKDEQFNDMDSNRMVIGGSESADLEKAVSINSGIIGKIPLAADVGAISSPVEVVPEFKDLGMQTNSWYLYSFLASAYVYLVDKYEGLGYASKLSMVKDFVLASFSFISGFGIHGGVEDQISCIFVSQYLQYIWRLYLYGSRGLLGVLQYDSRWVVLQTLIELGAEGLHVCVFQIYKEQLVDVVMVCVPWKLARFFILVSLWVMVGLWFEWIMLVLCFVSKIVVLSWV